jgi:hypothetical protein
MHQVTRCHFILKMAVTANQIVMHGQSWSKHQWLAVFHHPAGMSASEWYVLRIFFTLSCHKYAGFTRSRTIPGKHVVFGKVIRGFDDVVPKIAQVSTDEKDRPVVPVIVYNCGELELRKKAAPPRTCIILSLFLF